MINRRKTDHLASLIDHDLLIEIKVKVENLTHEVKSQNADLVTRVNKLEESRATNADLTEAAKPLIDHETRIRFIERYVWGAIAIIGLINLVGGAYLISLIT